MRSSLLLQRCLPGRNVRTLPKEATTEGTMAEAGMEVGGGATTSIPKAVEGDMSEEEVGEEVRGEAEGEEPEGATIRAVREEEEAMEEEATRATSRRLDTMAVEDTMTLTTRTETGITRGAGVEDLEEGEDAVVEEVEEAGEEEGGRI